MTERITTLLHEEADDLQTPMVDAQQVIARGRRLRRQHAAFQAVAGMAVVGVVAASALAVNDLRDSDRTVAITSGTVEGSSDWAVASGSNVHLSSGGEVQLTGAVKSLYYTSAGLLARTGQTADSDAPDSNYWLITNGGEVTDFRLSLGDRVPGTDPDEPFIAYAEPGADATHWTVVLRDVSTGDIADSFPIQGEFTWGGWVAPPVALDGDHVYVGLDKAMLDVNWREGSVAESATLPGSYMPTVRNGYEIIEQWHPDASGGSGDPQRTAFIIDVANGDRQRLPTDLDQTVAALSTDGRSVLLRSYSTCDENGGCTIDNPLGTLYNIDAASTSKISFNGASAVGWTRDGRMVQVGDGTVSVCDEGGCDRSGLNLGTGDIKVAGSIYES